MNFLVMTILQEVKLTVHKLGKRYFGHVNMRVQYSLSFYVSDSAFVAI